MLSFHRFAEISPRLWLELLNHPEVHRHMPLAGETWSEDAAAAWAEGKDAQWAENGYGPWALKVDGAFAGWGGFQKEGLDADLALVLLPAFWGHGRKVHQTMVAKGFGELGLPSITILLPPSRVRMKGLRRLGYVAEGEISYDGQRFLKFRMGKPSEQNSLPAQQGTRKPAP